MVATDLPHFLRAPPVESSDAELIHSSLQGNQKSFGQLIQRHEPAILRMVYRQLRQREEAEDVVQQVFLQAYRYLGNFRGDSKFFTWIYTIALNLVRNHVRQRKIRRTDSLDTPVNTENIHARQWPDPAPSPDAIAHHRSELDRVRVAVENLQEIHRVIFAAHYFQHLSLKDIAGRIDRPVGTVKVYLHRARKMVLQQLEHTEKS